MATATKEKRAAASDTAVLTERWLESVNVEWELRDIDLSQIDEAESLRNQARTTALIEPIVMRYAAEMEHGDEFPPLVVYERPRSKKLVIIDGNQRKASCDLVDRKTHPAYVVKDPTPRQIRVLTYTANKTHGAPNTDEDRLLHAAHLVEVEGESAASAARVIGVSVEKLRAFLHRRATERRLQDLGVRGWTQMPVHVRERLGNVRNDNVFREAARLVVEAEIPTPEISPIVTMINEKRTEDEQLKVLDAERAKRHIEIRERAGLKLPQVVRRINQVTGAVVRIDVEALETANLSGEYRDAVIQRIDEAREHLVLLRKSL